MGSKSGAQASPQSWTLLGSMGVLRVNEKISQFCRPLEAGDLVTTVLDLTDNGGSLSFEINGGTPEVAATGLRRFMPLVPMMDVWAHGSMRLMRYEATKMDLEPHGRADQLQMLRAPGEAPIG
jgi:hypothetical protein